MPLAPPYLLGVANLRGAVMPIVDIRPFLGVGPARDTREPDARRRARRDAGGAPHRRGAGARASRWTGAARRRRRRSPPGFSAGRLEREDGAWRCSTWDAFARAGGGGDSGWGGRLTWIDGASRFDLEHRGGGVCWPCRQSRVGASPAPVPACCRAAVRAAEGQRSRGHRPGRQDRHERRLQGPAGRPRHRALPRRPGLLQRGQRPGRRPRPLDRGGRARRRLRAGPVHPEHDPARREGPRCSSSRTTSARRP